jgi:hypothetical protein
MLSSGLGRAEDGKIRSELSSAVEFYTNGFDWKLRMKSSDLSLLGH